MATKTQTVRRRKPRRRVAKNIQLVAPSAHDIEYVKELQRQTAERQRIQSVLEKLQKKQKIAAKVRMDRGVILFEDIPYFFKLGDTVVDKFYGEPMAGTVVSVQERHGFMSRWFEIGMRVISLNSSGAVGFGIYTTKIYSWPDEMETSKISIHHITDDEKNKLIERGKMFREITKKARHMAYDGEILIPSWWSPTVMSAHGRVIVDGSGARLMQPDLMNRVFNYTIRSEDDDRDPYDRDEKFGEEEDNTVIEDKNLHLTCPIVIGFSFKQKRWGILKVSSLSEIEFDKTIFDKLVLDPERKKIIKSLVEYSGESFADIVKGKSGGFIFLLHGPPGVGKTLTAEATAEVLSRPLYIVSVGELGTEPIQLETELRKILDLADRWNAVLLLDEADIFLEARTDHDLVRNAMVGIFLRLLEYYNGVMFLTTNRVKNFDKAFHSRISLAIQYNPKDMVVFRNKVWTNLLEAAKVSNIDVAELEKLDLNGRQIKNCIRLAHTLAVSEGRKLVTEDLIAMANFAHQFTTELKNAENQV